MPPKPTGKPTGKPTPAQQGPVLSSMRYDLKKSLNSKVLMLLRKFRTLNPKNTDSTCANNFVNWTKHSKSNKNSLLILSKSASV